MSAITSTEYLHFVDNLKERVRSAQLRASLAVNHELIMLYWHIGRDILQRQAELGWGAKVVGQISKDLRAAFPEMKGFSSRNLKYMRAFAEAWPEEEFVQQAVAQIPWGHNVRILDKVEGQETRRFYIQQVREHSWSRNIHLSWSRPILRRRKMIQVEHQEWRMIQLVASVGDLRMRNCCSSKLLAAGLGTLNSVTCPNRFKEFVQARNIVCE